MIFSLMRLGNSISARAAALIPQPEAPGLDLQWGLSHWDLGYLQVMARGLPRPTWKAVFCLQWSPRALSGPAPEKCEDPGHLQGTPCSNSFLLNINDTMEQ